MHRPSWTTVALVVCLTHAARAAEDPPLVPEPQPDAPPVVTPPPESDTTRLRAYTPGGARLVPDDEARGWAEAPHDESEDAVLFVPRLVLFVPKAALWLVSQPLRGLLYLEDRLHVVGSYKSIFFSEDETAGVIPTLGYQSGYGFSAGLTYFDDDLLGHDEAFSVSASFGGREQQSYEIELEADRFAGTRMWLEARVAYESKPGLFFYGVGNGDLDAPAVADACSDGRGSCGPRDVTVGTNYLEDRFRATLGFGGTLGDPATKTEPGSIVKLGVSTTFDRLDGDRGGGGGAEDDDDDPAERPLETIYGPSKIAGFGGSYTLELLFTLTVDTRDRAGQTSRGSYFEAFAGGAPPIDREFEYTHFGMGLVTWFPLWSESRVLQITAFAEALGGDDEDIPVAKMVRMGAGQNLRGHVRDRFRDKVAAGASLAYLYPIHQWIQGEIFVDVGRVGRDLEEVFSFADWRWGAGGGLVIGDLDSMVCRLEVSYGEELVVMLSTDPFATFGDRKDQP